MNFPCAIRISGLTKCYPTSRRRWGLFSSSSLQDRPAVENISLEVEQGEFFGLLGQNGAGKTTLIKMLSTLIIPTSGKAKVNGYDLENEVAIKKSIGIVSGDERSFFWRLTGRQNLEFFAALHNIKPKCIRPRVEYLLELIGLKEFGNEIFRSYSTGMKQRLSIARALLHEPRILFLDEPTKGLDPFALKTIHNLFKLQLSQQMKVTIFMTTHRLDEAEKLCDRIAIMHQGRIRTEGTIADLRVMLGLTDRYQFTATEVGSDIIGHIEQFPAESKIISFDPNKNIIKFEIADDGKTLGTIVDLIRNNGGVMKDIRHIAVSLESIYGAIIPVAAADEGNPSGLMK